MNNNDLLAASKVELIRAYTAVLDSLTNECLERLYVCSDSKIPALQKKIFFDSSIALLNNKQQIKNQLEIEFKSLLDHNLQTAYSTFRPSVGGATNPSEMSLVSTSEVESKIWVDSITKKLQLEAGEQMRDLNIRVALLFEQDKISERENPFRPFLFSMSIFNAVQAQNLSSEIVAAIVEQFILELSEKIIDIYSALNTLLANHGIAAKLNLRIQQSPVQKKSASASSSAEISNNAPAYQNTNNNQRREDSLLQMIQSGFGKHIANDTATSSMRAPVQQQSPENPAGWSGWLSGPKHAGEVIRHFFSGTQTYTPDQTAASGLNDTNPAIKQDSTINPIHRINSVLRDSIQALQASTIPLINQMRLDASGQLRNLIIEHRDEFSSKAQSLNEQMIIDIVAMLFEFILRDSSVPAEIRAQLGRMQFLVLKTALLDSTLLTKKSHPARMLVNRIGSVSMSLQQVDPRGERIVGEVCRIIETLLATDAEDNGLFSIQLDELDSFIAHELRANKALATPALKVVARAERRTAQFTRIASTIDKALNGITIDDYMQEFLLNQWARVIEQASRTDPERALRYRSCIHILIWSIESKVTEKDRLLLTSLLPSLLATLKDGLKYAKYDRKRIDQLLNWLLKRHKLAWVSENVNVASPSLTDFQKRFQSFIDQEEQDALPPSQGLNPDGKILVEAMAEMKTQLILIDEELTAQELVVLKNQNTSSDSLFEQHPFEMLNTYVAIEINIAGHPTLASLFLSDTNARHLVLHLKGSERPSVISVKLFHHFLNTGRARFIENQPLFERAIEQLLSSADNHDRITPMQQKSA